MWLVHGNEARTVALLLIFLTFFQNPMLYVNVSVQIDMPLGSPQHVRRNLANGAIENRGCFGFLKTSENAM